MRFNEHRNLKGSHAAFSASSSAWLRYDDEKLLQVFRNLKAKELGTRLHAWAAETIELGMKQPRSKKAIYEYINDAIGFKMDVEVLLWYSDRFFGTADTICFRNNVLRIHDLKTGESPVHMEQLLVYAALFCLEYKYNPEDIQIELRIYQVNRDIETLNPDPQKIREIMDKIIHFNAVLADAEKEDTIK